MTELSKVTLRAVRRGKEVCGVRKHHLIRLEHNRSGSTRLICECGGITSWYANLVIERDRE